MLSADYLLTKYSINIILVNQTSFELFSVSPKTVGSLISVLYLPPYLLIFFHSPLHILTSLFVLVWVCFCRFCLFCHIILVLHDIFLWYLPCFNRFIFVLVFTFLPRQFFSFIGHNKITTKGFFKSSFNFLTLIFFIYL